MSNLLDAVKGLAVAALPPNCSPKRVNEAFTQACPDLRGASQADLNSGLELLALCLGERRLLWPGPVAQCCGAMVECGGNPLVPLGVALRRLREPLSGCPEFATICREEVQAIGRLKGPESNVQIAMLAQDLLEDFQHGRTKNSYMGGLALAYLNLKPLALGAIAMLAHSKEARRLAREQTDLLQLAMAAAGDCPEAGFLAQMLQVLDEEPLLVLHPGEKKGFRVRISGIGGNEQLFVLLEDALIGAPGEGWLTGSRPAPALASACRDQPPEVAEGSVHNGQFNYFNWQALQADKTLPEGPQQPTEHWISMEGIPVGVQLFEGLRVLLLGPPPYGRALGGRRRFPSMKAELRVEAKLASVQVRTWIKSLVAARVGTVGF